MEEKLFKIHSDYKPMGDQPAAIDSLVAGLKRGEHEQVLLGATGTGKTFTIANVIEKVNKPTLVFAHNKTLAGQLYSEFKALFPENAVEYFISNFDFYQPEAYMPKTDTYIEKNAVTNDEIDMLRMSAYNSLLERRDVIVVASVACIYAGSNPEDYKEMFFSLKVGEIIDRQDLIKRLVVMQYQRNDMDALRGTFSVKGDVIEVRPGHTDKFVIRIEMFDDEIERITEVDPLTKNVLNGYTVYSFFPASGYARNRDDLLIACDNIEKELEERLKYFKEKGKLLEYERLEQRCRYDIEALREMGMCSGIENYAMHIDHRVPGERPYNLFDYFGDDFLIVVDESHVSLPQIRGMYNGDHQRKLTLVEYGFRLPSALENRPMTFEEWEELKAPRIYMSATPGDYELEHSPKPVEQLIRPTGLLDPTVEVRKTSGQIDDLMEEIRKNIEKHERTLVTTLTVKMAEDLTDYLKKLNFKVAYLHHETKTLERSEIIHDLRAGKYDVLIGINLLREGLDIPEVSLIAILDADKEGFLRSSRSLIQTIGRAARNEHGRVIMYADVMTDSMSQAINETARRRQIQEAYNKENNIIPRSIRKELNEVIHSKETREMSMKYRQKHTHTKKEKEKMMASIEAEMRQAAKQLNFERAAELRDILYELRDEK
ncbi:MAG: excinuclease ABC subunit UvrB [Erysipelotrichaceae bacterium]|nr:excinuclease ABC subunit UvrB [Erysipelotrichaceae bacterium]MBQ1287064.1 excinuclease ABC subunit UvrB [Erysipelotrichaceae bacterium]MBQ1811294.1 excinuclease ABC subunit UvrB [Erysipelotrichaceae bacterium]MBR4609537.1 excinuclease ABC subunit UvrB [Erysipelotrichaceae bacterium]MEE3424127.1 excinuclease ABC subunit UvrB [Erysipelotrichaceae bacterium]